MKFTIICNITRREGITLQARKSVGFSYLVDVLNHMLVLMRGALHSVLLKPDRAELIRGIVCFLPVMILLIAGQTTFGLLMTPSILSIALLGAESEIKKARTRLLAVAATGPLLLICGSILGVSAVAAIVGLGVGSFLAGRYGARTRFGKFLPFLLLPLFTAGISVEPQLALSIAPMLLAGGLWAVFVAIIWPLRSSSASSSTTTTTPPDKPSDSMLKLYGVKLGIGVSVATLLVYLLNFQHVGWAPMSVVMILRPQQDITKKRGFMRIIGTFIGILIAWLLYNVFTQDLVRAAIIGSLGAFSISYRQTVLSSLPIASTTAIILLFAISEPALLTAQGSVRLADNVLAFGILVALEMTLQKFVRTS